MLLRLHIEHELRQRAMQAGDGPAHDGKARAGDFGARIKIQPQRRAQIDMVFGLKAQWLRVAPQAALRRPAAQLDVGAFVRPHGHAGMRQIGHAGQNGFNLGLQGFEAHFGGLQLLLDVAHLRHHGICPRMVALAFERADLLAQAVALGLQIFGAGLQGFALGFKRGKSCLIQPGLRVLAGLQAGDDAGQIFAQQGDV